LAISAARRSEFRSCAVLRFRRPSARCPSRFLGFTRSAGNAIRATDAFARRPLSSAYRLFVRPTSKGSFGSRAVGRRPKSDVSEGRKRAFPGDALWARFPDSTERPYVRAGRRGMNGGREIRRFVAGDYRLRLLRPKNGIRCVIASSARARLEREV
jgi:hypothetical protein